MQYSNFNLHPNTSFVLKNAEELENPHSKSNKLKYLFKQFLKIFAH